MSFMHPYTKRPISAAARQRRPTNNGWQTGLIGFDWVRLDTPTTLTGDKNTTPAAVRNDFLSFRSWRSGWNEGGSVFFQTMRNYMKLSWKSTTCVSQPSILIDPNRSAGGF